MRYVQHMPRSAALIARDAALLRLMELHRSDYDRIYDEERESRGLKPLSARRVERITELEQKLARLKGQPLTQTGGDLTGWPFP